MGALQNEKRLEKNKSGSVAGIYSGYFTAGCGGGAGEADKQATRPRKVKAGFIYIGSAMTHRLPIES